MAQAYQWVSKERLARVSGPGRRRTWGVGGLPVSETAVVMGTAAFCGGRGEGGGRGGGACGGPAGRGRRGGRFPRVPHSWIP
ncbi:hypothetical protein GCM10009544_25650 [Streptomyces stramineus]|uniref:Uncharacterized protein n=1 Tax=Streptomyces stramineus TaxID=173861 RepID=A0ABP3JT39_9ACTN